MKINLKEAKYYFLTCNNEIRRTHMLNEFKELDITEVNPITGIGKNMSGATGFSKIFDLACMRQDRTKPFQPFIFYEDDIKKFREFPDVVDIPDNTDLMHMGLSSWGMTDAPEGVNGSICFEAVDGYPDIVKISNMLALHGMIVCSVRGLLALQKCMIEGYFKDIIWDIYTAQIQAHVNTYAFRTPLVYQYAPIGGQEVATNIQIPEKDKCQDVVFPSKWKNKTNVSVITNYSKKLDMKGVYHFNCENIKEQTLKYMKEDKINLKNIIFFQRKDNQEENQKNIFYIDSHDICQVIKDNALQASSIDTIVINGSDNILFGNILQSNKQLIQDNIKHILVYNVNDASYINKSMTILNNVEIENNSIYNLHNNEILIKVIN